MISKQLQQKGYSIVHYPKELRDAVETLFLKWKDFTSLDQDVKDLTSNNEDEGYEIQLKEGVTNDIKEDFHATLNGIARLMSQDNLKPAVLDFLEANTKVLNLIERSILSFAQAIQNEGTCVDFFERVKKSKNRWIVRCIHYFPGRSVGSHLASSHPDKSGLTFHLFEDTPGFQYFWEGEHEDVSFASGTTLVIAGMQTQLVTGLNALSHRVVATPESSLSGRFSIVLFVPLADTPWWNKEEKGRLQDFSPGYFYNMPQEELSEYFL